MISYSSQNLSKKRFSNLLYKPPTFRECTADVIKYTWLTSIVVSIVLPFLWKNIQFVHLFTVAQFSRCGRENQWLPSSPVLDRIKRLSVYGPAQTQLNWALGYDVRLLLKTGTSHRSQIRSHHTFHPLFPHSTTITQSTWVATGMAFGQRCHTS